MSTQILGTVKPSPFFRPYLHVQLLDDGTSAENIARLLADVATAGNNTDLTRLDVATLDNIRLGCQVFIDEFKRLARARKNKPARLVSLFARACYFNAAAGLDDAGEAYKKALAACDMVNEITDDNVKTVCSQCIDYYTNKIARIIDTVPTTTEPEPESESESESKTIEEEEEEEEETPAETAEETAPRVPSLFQSLEEVGRDKSRYIEKPLFWDDGILLYIFPETRRVYFLINRYSRRYWGIKDERRRNFEENTPARSIDVMDRDLWYMDYTAENVEAFKKAFPGYYQREPDAFPVPTAAPAAEAAPAPRLIGRDPAPRLLTVEAPAEKALESVTAPAPTAAPIVEPASAADNRDALINETFDAIKNKVIKNSEAVTYMLERSIDADCPLWSEKWFGFAELPRKYFDGRRYSTNNMILLGFQGGFYISESEARRLLGDNVKPKSGAIARRVLMPVFLGAKTPNKKELQALRDGEETANTPNSYPDFYRVERVYDQTAFEGLPLKKTRELPNTPNERNDRAEKVLKDFCAANNIIFTATLGGASACCEHVEDPKAPININVPDISQFKSATAYYSVVFHECTHAANRRNGCQLTKKREELAAEIGACIVLNSLGFDPAEYIDDAAAYVREFKDAAKGKNAIKKAWKYALSSALLILKTFIDDQTADAETTTAAEQTPAANEAPADGGKKKVEEISEMLAQYWDGLRKLDESWTELRNAKLRQFEGNISERISAARSEFPALSAEWGRLNQRLANIRMTHAARERYWERERKINQGRLF